MIVGLIWSVWHVPMMLMGATIALLFVLSTTVLSVLLAHLAEGSPRQRVLVAGLAHWLVNLAILLVGGAAVEARELVPEVVAIVLTAGVGLGVLATARRRGLVS